MSEVKWVELHLIAGNWVERVETFPIKPCSWGGGVLMDLLLRPSLSSL
jgi:hypothetical protein